MQQKWKNIRTSFRRELKRLAGAKSGAAASRKSPYTYFLQLQFLKDSCELNKTQGNMDEPADDNESEDNSARRRVRSRSPITKKKIQTEEEERGNLVNILKQSVTMREERERIQESDSDRLFLLALLPDLKKIPEYRKLSTKMELINIINKNQENPIQTNYARIPSSNEQYFHGYTSRSNYTINSGQYRPSQDYSAPRTTDYRYDYTHSVPSTSHGGHVLQGYSTSPPNMEETITETINEVLSPTNTIVSEESQASQLIDLF